MASTPAVVKQEVGDESDSCFEFIKQRNLAKVEALKELEKKEQDSPKMVRQSAPKVMSVAPIKVVPVSSSGKPVGLSSSPLKHKIDRIAENLKAKQEMRQMAMPKVVLVKPIDLDKSKKDEQSRPKEAKELNEKLKSLKISTKELAHQLILLRSRKLSSSDLELSVTLTPETGQTRKQEADMMEMSDDLTNLSWLTTFNLSAKSMSLSPPCSPPLSPHNNVTVSSIEDEEDEADNNSCHQSNRIQSSSPLIAQLIKPWQAVSKQTGRQRPPFSYSCLSFLAIEASQRKRLSVKEIYAWLINSFPYYRSVPSGSWKNSIRHNLALNSCFAKVDKNLLAMRDFSGKGSLWCVSGHVQAKLSETLEKSCPDQFSHLLNSPLLQDSSETPKQYVAASVNHSPRQPAPQQTKAPKQHSRSLSAHPTTIINPRLTHKLAFNSTSHTKTPPIGQAKPSADCLTDIDAVNALLSMKSRSSSMPSSTRPDSVSTTSAKQGRRKQVFKPPMKKPHINPKLLQSNTPFFYNDGDDDEDEMEEELEEDDEELSGKKVPNKHLLQIRFPRYVSHCDKKSAQSKDMKLTQTADNHIVTMSDDEDEDAENRLQIDEEPIQTSLAEELNSEESNLEPGEIRKPSAVKRMCVEEKGKARLLNVKASDIVTSKEETVTEEEEEVGEKEENEKEEEEEEKEEVGKVSEVVREEPEREEEVKAKRPRITEVTQVTPRATRSSNAKLAAPTVSTPITRSATTFGRKKSK